MNSKSITGVMLIVACCLASVARAAQPVDLSRLPRVWERLKADEEITVVALGDSITTYFGNNSRNRRSYRAPLQVSYYGVFAGYLKMPFPAARVRLINKGIGGETANRGRDRVNSDVLSQKPDLVFVMYGANDGRAGRDVQQYCFDLKEIVAKVRATGADVILVAPTMSLVDLAWLLPYRQAVLDLRHELDCPVLDGTLALWPVDEGVYNLADVHQYLARHFPPNGDDIHPGINGHFQMGRRMWEQLTDPTVKTPLDFELIVSGPICLPGNIDLQLKVTNVSARPFTGAVQVFFPKDMPVEGAAFEEGKLALRRYGRRRRIRKRSTTTACREVCMAMPGSFLSAVDRSQIWSVMCSSSSSPT